MGISIRAKRPLYGRKVDCPMVIFMNCLLLIIPPESFVSISDAGMASGVAPVINSVKFLYKKVVASLKFKLTAR